MTEEKKLIYEPDENDLNDIVKTKSYYKVMEKFLYGLVKIFKKNRQNLGMILDKKILKKYFEQIERMEKLLDDSFSSFFRQIYYKPENILKSENLFFLKKQSETFMEACEKGEKLDAKQRKNIIDQFHFSDQELCKIFNVLVSMISLKKELEILNEEIEIESEEIKRQYSQRIAKMDKQLEKINEKFLINQYLKDYFIEIKNLIITVSEKLNLKKRSLIEDIDILSPQYKPKKRKKNEN